MDRQDLLRQVAETGYNVGLGAKKHMATYDIVEKLPGLIGFVSISVGVLALIFDVLAAKFISALLVILGVVGLYVSFYDPKKSEYERAGSILIQIFNELKRLYGDIKTCQESDLAVMQEKLVEIEGRYYKNSISKQMLFSEWYAHYKFFWQHQIEWVDEQKKFRLFRDKIPLTFSIFIFISIAFMVVYFFKFSDIAIGLYKAFSCQ